MEAKEETGSQRCQTHEKPPSILPPVHPMNTHSKNTESRTPKPHKQVRGSNPSDAGLQAVCRGIEESVRSVAVVLLRHESRAKSATASDGVAAEAQSMGEGGLSGVVDAQRAMILAMEADVESSASLRRQLTEARSELASHLFTATPPIRRGRAAREEAQDRGSEEAQEDRSRSEEVQDRGRVRESAQLSFGASPEAKSPIPVDLAPSNGPTLACLIPYHPPMYTPSVSASSSSSEAESVAEEGSSGVSPSNRQPTVPLLPRSPPEEEIAIESPPPPPRSRREGPQPAPVRAREGEGVLQGALARELENAREDIDVLEETLYRYDGAH